MEFHDAQAFGKKRIAYRYLNDPEPGTNLVGTVVVLEPIQDSGSVPVLTDLVGHSSESIRIVPINQTTFNQLASGQPALGWPPVHSGNTSGKLSMFVSVDRKGHIREAYPLNSDNAGLQDAARDQLLKWQLKPAVANGSSVQIEVPVTFSFSTTVDGTSGASTAGADDSSVTATNMKPIIVSPAIVGSLQIKSFAPVYPQGLREKRIGGDVQLKAVIGKNGQIISLTPISSANPELTNAAIAAVQRWAYKPYLLNGSPVEIETILTLHFRAP